MQNEWIVSKFGGSSVRDKHAMLRCSEIVENNSRIKIVIISATFNTTNQLEFVAQAALRGDHDLMAQVINEIETKHLHLGQELYTSVPTLDELKILFNELKVIGHQIFKERDYSPKTMDRLYSLGERMSSLLFADLLRLRIPTRTVHFLDARKVIKTNSDFQKAEPLIELIYQYAKEEIGPGLNDNRLFVTQGFIGEDTHGATTTLGREGSDYSAALFGEAIRASLIQIWTDVKGIATTDPRLVQDVRYIPRLGYEEATAMASLGAKVLFSRTLEPAKRHNIPVFVGSSLLPQAGGTIIENIIQKDFKLNAVSLMKNYMSGPNSGGMGWLVSFTGVHLENAKHLDAEIRHFFKERNIDLVLIDTTNFSLSMLAEDDHEKIRLLEIGHEYLISKSLT